MWEEVKLECERKTYKCKQLLLSRNFLHFAVQENTALLYLKWLF